MAKLVSFNRDAPALKCALRSEEDLSFGLFLSAEYLTFAGERELRALRIQAYNGFKRYALEFRDCGALIAWLRDTCGLEARDAYECSDQVRMHGLVHIPYDMTPQEVKQAGFQPYFSEEPAN